MAAKGILKDDYLVLAKSFFDRRGKSFVRAVPLHIGLPGKNEQVLGMMLGSCAQAKKQRKKDGLCDFHGIDE